MYRILIAQDVECLRRIIIVYCIGSEPYIVSEATHGQWTRISLWLKQCIIIYPTCNLVGMVFNMGYAVVAASVNNTC